MCVWLVAAWDGSYYIRVVSTHNVSINRCTVSLERRALHLCSNLRYPLCVWLVTTWDGSYHIRVVLTHNLSVSRCGVSLERRSLHLCI